MMDCSQWSSVRTRTVVRQRTISPFGMVTRNALASPRVALVVCIPRSGLCLRSIVFPPHHPAFVTEPELCSSKANGYESAELSLKPWCEPRFFDDAT